MASFPAVARRCRSSEWTEGRQSSEEVRRGDLTDFFLAQRFDIVDLLELSRQDCQLALCLQPSANAKHWLPAEKETSLSDLLHVFPRG